MEENAKSMDFMSNIEKLHVVPLNETAPKKAVMEAIQNLKKNKTCISRSMRFNVYSAENGGDSEDDSCKSFNHTIGTTSHVVEYAVVEATPSKGYLNNQTLIYTMGGPVKLFNEVQIIALVNPNSASGRELGLEKSVAANTSSTNPTSSSNSNVNEVTNNSNFIKSKSGTDIEDPDNSKTSQNCVPPNLFRGIKSTFNGLGKRSASSSKSCSQSNKGNTNKFESEHLYSNFVRPYLLSHQTDIFYSKFSFNFLGITFLIWDTKPRGEVGIINSDTLIYVNADPWGEYRYVHIVPIRDTLPTLYDYNVFEDYLKPHFKKSWWKVYSIGDIVAIDGVQFKVMATEPLAPDGRACRIGRDTVIDSRGDTLPTLLDILPPDLNQRVRRLPVRQQLTELYYQINTLDAEQVMRLVRATNVQTSNTREQRNDNREFLNFIQNQVTIFDKKKYFETCLNTSNVYSPQTSSVLNNDSKEKASTEVTCTVCTAVILNGQKALILPCRHAFHWNCVEAWLRCNDTCPNCRLNLRNSFMNSDVANITPSPPERLSTPESAHERS